MKAPLYNAVGELIGEIELNATVFGVKPEKHILWEITKMYLDNKRQGTHKSKTRAEVNASGRKIWPQKGLGRARHGDIKAPVFVGGGKAHGPRPRDYYHDIPVQIRRKALLYSLADKARDGKILVIEKFNFEEPKTKKMAELLSKMGLNGVKTLLLTADYSKNTYLSARNIPTCDVTTAKDVNALDVLNSRCVIIEKDGLSKIEERLLS